MTYFSTPPDTTPRPHPDHSTRDRHQTQRHHTPPEPPTELQTARQPRTHTTAHPEPQRPPDSHTARHTATPHSTTHRQRPHHTHDTPPDTLQRPQSHARPHIAPIHHHSHTEPLKRLTEPHRATPTPDHTPRHTLPRLTLEKIYEFMKKCVDIR